MINSFSKTKLTLDDSRGGSTFARMLALIYYVLIGCLFFLGYFKILILLALLFEK
jgi:hypothetical protein